jgi:hypothetical protein
VHCQKKTPIAPESVLTLTPVVEKGWLCTKLCVLRGPSCVRQLFLPQPTIVRGRRIAASLDTVTGFRWERHKYDKLRIAVAKLCLIAMRRGICVVAETMTDEMLKILTNFRNLSRPTTMYQDRQPVLRDVCATRRVKGSQTLVSTR